MTEPTQRYAWVPVPGDGPSPAPPQVPQPPFAPTVYGPPPPAWSYGLTQSVPDGWPEPGPAMAPMPTPVPFQPVVATQSRIRQGRRPSAYAVSFLVAAVVCAGGVGFLGGRQTAPRATAAAAPDGGFGRFAPGQGLPGAFAGASPATPDAAAETTGPAVANGSTAAPTAPPAGNAPPAGGVPGRGLGGLQGTVTAMDAAGLTVQLTSGDTLQVATNADTLYYRRSAATPADVSVGSQVQVQVAGGFGGPGGFGQGGPVASPAPGTSQTAAATGVTVLEQTAAPTPAPSGSGQQGRGFGGRGGLQGTVTAMDAAGLTLQLTSGDMLQVATNADTLYYRRSAATPADVSVGSQVQVQVAGGFGGPGGFGQGGPVASPAPGTSQTAASDITVLQP